MKHILSYLKLYKKESILGPLFKLLEALFELFVPLVIADVIDNGIAIGAETGDKSYIIWRVVLMVGLGVIGLVCALVAQYFAAKAATGVAATLRSELFAKIMKLSDSDVDRLGTSTLITRITGDVNQIQSGLNLGIRLLLRSPFIVFGAMIMAFTIDVKSALVFVVVIPVLTVVVFAIILSTAPLYKKVQGKLDSVTLITRENLAGSRVIRAFRREKSEQEQFGRIHGELTASQTFVGRISALLNPVTYIIINLGVLAVIYVGGLRVESGAISQGNVVALVNYMSQILVELIKLANLIITLSKSIASANRVDVILQAEPELKFVSSGDGDSSSFLSAEGGNHAANNCAACAVRMADVSFAYPGAGADSVSDISFEVKAGETVGIIGGTGSGKSTIMNLLMRAYDVSGGAVELFGRNVKDYPEAELKALVSVVPQKAVLFKGTVRENLLVGKPDATDAECIEALKISQSYDFVEGKGGLDAETAQNGDNFSGGQKQRLSIARAVVKDAPILVLDDSFSALDYITEAKLKDALDANAHKANSRTTFIISQRASTILNADKILVMDDGQIVGCGTHEELLNNCEIYQEIYYSQYERS